MADRIPLDIKITAASAGAWVVAPIGDIAYHEAPAFRAGIKEALDKRPARLIADLAGVPYMGTPGVATLVEALKLAKQAGVPLVICGMTDRVRGVFEIARLHTVFKIVPDVAAALSA